MSVARLLIRPRPMKGESLRGYLLYLGQENELGSSLLIQLGDSPSKGTEKILSEITSWTAIEANELPEVWCTNKKGAGLGHWVWGLPLPLPSVRLTQCAVCPKCLEACPRTRGEWEVKAFCVCPDHGCFLIDKCQGCKQAISWDRSKVVYCRCGFDLRRADSSPATRDSMALCSLISSRYRGLSTGDIFSEVGFPKELHKQSLPMLVAAIASLNWMRSSNFSHWIGGKYKTNASKHFLDQSASLMYAAQRLTMWPSIFLKTLEDATRHNDDSSGLESDVHVIRWPHIVARLSPSKEVAVNQGIPDFVRKEADRFRRRRTFKFHGKEFIYLQRKPDSRLNRRDCTDSRKGTFRLRDDHVFSNEAAAYALGVTREDLNLLSAAGIAPPTSQAIRPSDLNRAMYRLRRSLGYFGEVRAAFRKLLGGAITDPFELVRAVNKHSNGRYGRPPFLRGDGESYASERVAAKEHRPTSGTKKCR